MTDKHDTPTEEGTCKQGANDGRDIRLLKRKQRKGPGAMIWAVLFLGLGIVYALLVRAFIAPQVPHGQMLNGDQAASILVDRLWVDRVPEKDTDKFNFYIFSSEENIALNDQAQSSYRHLLEIFFYRATAHDISYQFPHDRRSGKTAYAVEKLAKPDRNQIDMKLTLVADPQAENKTKVYFSSTKWSSLDNTTLPASLRKVPALPALIR